MDRDRPGGGATQPGALPSDFDKQAAARRDEAAPSAQASSAPEAAQFNQHPRFTVESGGTRSFATAAQRIGGALGSRGWKAGSRFSGEPEPSRPAGADAHRRLRNGLEVVGEDPPSLPPDQPPPSPHAIEARAQDPFECEDDIAARMMDEIEKAVAELRRHAAGRLISLHRPAEPTPQQPAQSVGCGLLHGLLTRIQQRARRLASEKPLETAAAVIALGLAFGAALRLRKSHP